MGWLRSNWLDALIFLLVAVIMAGVIFFLTGVNPLSALQGGSQNPPVVVTPTPQPTPTPTPQPKPEAKPTPKPEPKPEPKPQPQADPEPVVTILPVPKAPQDTPKPDKPIPAPPKVEDKPQPSPTPAQPVQTPQPEPTPATPKPQPVSVAADAAGAYSVAVGSFANPDNAARLVQTLKGQGYPASAETVGNLTRVWVGPYQNAAKARAVAGTLGKYQPQVARSAVPSAQPAQPQTPATPTTTPTQPTPSAVKYLQVGAFRSAKSAQAVVEKVREAGYPVVLVEGGGFVRVRVGPLDNPSEAAAALRARGLEVLEVR